MRIGFQGKHGAFSEEAAIELLGDAIEVVPCKTFESLFKTIDEDKVDSILAPVENTLAGTVHRSYELLVESNLQVVSETITPIRHQLIGCSGSSLNGIRTVESHPVALAQCCEFFVLNPHIERVATDDTAASIKHVVESNDLTKAAIGSKRAASIYGGQILKENVEDHKENFTRFFLLSKVNQNKNDADKVSLVMRLSHSPGALYESLRPFAEREINLLKLESYPIRGKPWEYRFYLDVQIPKEASQIEDALIELEKNTSELKILGKYKSANRNLTAEKRGM